jgi:low temperature requirement protein LtrA
VAELRSRWHHPAQLHRPGHGNEKNVGWIELFYDLIYVAAIIQLGNALAGTDESPLSGTKVLGFVGLFVPIWLTWTTFTF